MQYLYLPEFEKMHSGKAIQMDLFSAEENKQETFRQEKC